jgi:hypothetical protein
LTKSTVGDFETILEILGVFSKVISGIRSQYNLKIIELLFGSKFGLVDWLVESKACFWLDLNDISIAEEMADSFSTNHSDA